MPSLPRISGRQCASTLAKIGFVRVRQRGSHMILRREDPRITITIPDHDELDRGTLRAIIRAVGLSVQEFIDLL